MRWHLSTNETLHDIKIPKKLHRIRRAISKIIQSVDVINENVDTLVEKWNN